MVVVSDGNECVAGIHDSGIESNAAANVLWMSVMREI